MNATLISDDELRQYVESHDWSAGEPLPYWFRDYTPEQRTTLAAQGKALPDKSYPIVDKEDLSNAVQAAGRAKNFQRAKAFIKKRAQALGSTSVLPDKWNNKPSAEEVRVASELETELTMAALSFDEAIPAETAHTNNRNHLHAHADGQEHRHTHAHHAEVVDHDAEGHTHRTDAFQYTTTVYPSGGANAADGPDAANTMARVINQQTRQHDSPDTGDLHVSGMTKFKKVQPKQMSKGKHFLAKMYSLFKDRMTAHEFKQATVTARAYAGGMARAENKRQQHDDDLAESSDIFYSLPGRPHPHKGHPGNRAVSSASGVKVGRSSQRLVNTRKPGQARPLGTASTITYPLTPATGSPVAGMQQPVPPKPAQVGFDDPYAPQDTSTYDPWAFLNQGDDAPLPIDDELDDDDAYIGDDNIDDSTPDDEETEDDYYDEMTVIDGAYMQHDNIPAIANPYIGMSEPVDLLTFAGRHGPEDPGSWRLFVELPQTFIEPSPRIPYLPKPGIYEHPKYGTVVISRERNQRFADNMNQKVYQDRIPLDLEHETKLSGAAAWITGIMMNQDGSADALVEWTPMGDQAVRENRFIYISPEWFDTWKNPITNQTFQDVPIGGALCTRPFFKDRALNSLIATEDGLSVYERRNDMRGTESQNTQLGPAGTPPVVGATNNLSSATLSTIPGQPVGAPQQQFTELQLKFAEQEKRFAEVLEQNKAFAEQMAKMQGDAQNKRFTDEVLGRSDANGVRWYGETDGHITMLQDLAKAFGEDSPQVQRYIERERGIANQMHDSNVINNTVLKVFGAAGANTSESTLGKVEGLARRFRESDPSMTEPKAIAKALSENPQLYDAYVRDQEHRVRNGS